MRSMGPLDRTYDLSCHVRAPSDTHTSTHTSDTSTSDSTSTSDTSTSESTLTVSFCLAVPVSLCDRTKLGGLSVDGRRESLGLMQVGIYIYVCICVYMYVCICAYLCVCVCDRTKLGSLPVDGRREALGLMQVSE